VQNALKGSSTGLSNVGIEIGKKTNPRAKKKTPAETQGESRKRWASRNQGEGTIKPQIYGGRF